MYCMYIGWTVYCLFYALYELCTVCTMYHMHYVPYALCTVWTLFCMNYVLYRDPVLSVGISVSNIEKSVLYWKDLLGMQVVQVRVRPLSEYIFGLCVILYPINVKIAILIRHKLWQLSWLPMRERTYGKVN